MWFPVTKPNAVGIHAQCRKSVFLLSTNMLHGMARILNIFLDRKTNRFCVKYPDHGALFAGLGREESDAIRCLSARVSGQIFSIGKNYRLPDDDIEELICDCVTISLQKIKEGKYLFQGYNPATYVVEIAKNRVRNFHRNALRHDTTDLENYDERAEEPEFGSFAETELLEKLLAQLETNCQNLIRLKYLEERRDKEVIEEKLTQYTTVDALKNHRSKCMKKLVEIGATASLYNQ